MANELSANQLEVMAIQIRSSHAKVTKAYSDALVHARVCGEKLLRVKAQLGRGEFYGWIEENCEISDRHARRYMQISENWDAVADQRSVREALETLKLPSPAKPTKPKTDTPVSAFPPKVAATEATVCPAEGGTDALQGATEGPTGDAAGRPGTDGSAPAAAGEAAWEVMAAKHKSWVNDLNRIRREVEKTDKEHAYLRHCAVRIRNDLKALVATINQNTPVDANWKTKGEVERRRR